MDFGKFDIVLLTTMSLAVVIMSFTFPALDMTDQADEANESDIPEFNISSSQWDIAGEFPESPGTPARGTLIHDEELGNSITGKNVHWLDRPKDQGLSVEVQNVSSDFQIVVTNWENETGTPSVVYTDEYPISSEGDTVLHQNGTWSIEFEVDSLENYRQSNMTAEVSYNILDGGDGSGGGLSALPVIGGIFGAAEELVGMLGWLGLIIRWFVATIFEIALGLLAILLSIMVFAVDIMVWLTTTYFSIVSGAGTFGSVFLMIPGILLFAEFAKLGMLGIKLLPTT